MRMNPSPKRMPSRMKRRNLSSSSPSNLPADASPGFVRHLGARHQDGSGEQYRATSPRWLSSGWSAFAPSPPAALPGALLAIIVLSGTLLFSASPARAQKDSQSDLRAVRGVVIDKAENPVVGAIVYLKNVRTLTVKTYISDDSGQYRFSGLDPNVDYEMHAEHDDQTSANHTVSSFDSRKDIVVSLKVDKAKKKDER
jgi:Carboxypeptidase regulatory-like domain